MRKTLLSLICLALIQVNAFAEYIEPTPLRCNSYEQITVANSAIGLTAAKYTSSTLGHDIQMVSCTLQDAEIRFRLDGSDPTTTVGTPLQDGESFTLYSVTDMSNFSAIRTGGTSGILNCHYCRR